MGIHPVTELLRARPDRVRVVYLSERRHEGALAGILRLCRSRDIRVERLSPDAFRRQFRQGEGSEQGVAALTAAAEPVPLESMFTPRLEGAGRPWLVFLDGIEDPRNLGAIVRSAEATGASGLVIPQRRAAPLGSTAARTSAGAVHHLPYAVVSNLKYGLERVREAGMKVVCLEAEGGRPPWEEDLRGPVAVVLGSEGQGLRPVIRKRCDRSVSIPMPGNVESLNVSVAAGILFYEILRQRLQKSEL